MTFTFTSGPTVCNHELHVMGEELEAVALAMEPGEVSDVLGTEVRNRKITDIIQ